MILANSGVVFNDISVILLKSFFADQKRGIIGVRVKTLEFLL
jgi:hypothetical protein